MHQSQLNSILLLGGTSIIGFNLFRTDPGRFRPIRNPFNTSPGIRGWEPVKLEDEPSLRALMQRCDPRVVIHCHAVCDVAKCEANPEWARRLNVESLRMFLGLLPPSARLLYISSDHVFGGDGAYTESSIPSPISVYGHTRVEAERLVTSRPNTLVIRTGLPIGPSADGRSGHYDWLRYRYQAGLPITVIRDESRSVVGAHDLARRLIDLIDSGVCGVRHLTAAHVLSRPVLAAQLMKLQGLPARFEIRDRQSLDAPHLGKVEIRTDYRDQWADPLPSVFPADVS